MPALCKSSLASMMAENAAHRDIFVGGNYSGRVFAGAKQLSWLGHLIRMRSSSAAVWRAVPRTEDMRRSAGGPKMLFMDHIRMIRSTLLK